MTPTSESNDLELVSTANRDRETSRSVSCTTWAKGYSAGSETADPTLYFERRFAVSSSWGPPIDEGDTALHLGCGDGTFSQLLIERLRCPTTACDISDVLLKKTTQRIGETPLLAAKRCDINDWPLPFDEPFDHVLAIMRSLYQYTVDPQRTLFELHRLTKKKLILDFNPRKVDSRQVVSALRKAGFTHVELRAFLVPQTKRVPTVVQSSLLLFERVPLVYRILTKRNFYMWALATK